MLNGLKFTKMQALGNDYIYIDAVNQLIERPETLARQMCNRHFGIGSDGLVLICPSHSADYKMRIFNFDGSEAEMCGNAIRSVAKFVYHYGMTKSQTVAVETIGGIKHLTMEVRDGAVTNITADLGKPVFDKEKIPVLTEKPDFVDQPVVLDDRVFHTTAISMGNPHCVSFVEDVDRLDLAKYGPLMEKNPLFPRKINAEFTQILSRDRLRMRTWERNTGETMACGTGCCVSVVAGTLTGRCDPIATIEQVGGLIHVAWDRTTGHMYMTGPSEIVFEGVWRVSHLETEPIDRTDRMSNFAGRA